MNRKYYSLKNTSDIYYTGEDQKKQPNLINMQTGSEYFLPGYMPDDWERQKENFLEITKECALKLIPTHYGNHSN